jgi:flavin-dependent dehydrogenase
MESCDVLVVGGGPAGATASALLAREGFSVVLAERSRFPRYHVGESLLPAALVVLNLLGVRHRVEGAGFQIKRGTHFEWGSQAWDYHFREVSDVYAQSWQVSREEYDAILLEHAASLGVRVVQGTEVHDVEFAELGQPVSARLRGQHDQQLSFRILIDASGRAGLLATKYLGTRMYHEGLRNVALWAYWSHGRAPDVGPEGAVNVCSTRDGWLWGIPLREGVWSVGLVLPKAALNHAVRSGASLEQIYSRSVEDSELIRCTLISARRASGLYREQDFSYGTRCFAGPAFFIVGDAACFVDPLLATGIHLAQYSAYLAAAAAASELRDEVSQLDACSFYSSSYAATYTRILSLVASFYDMQDDPGSAFHLARQLIVDDALNALEPRRAFMSIAAGLQDFEDSGHAVHDANLRQLFTVHKEVVRASVHADQGESHAETRRLALVQHDLTAMLNRLVPTESEQTNHRYKAVNKPRLGLESVDS